MSGKQLGNGHVCTSGGARRVGGTLEHPAAHSHRWLCVGKNGPAPASIERQQRRFFSSMSEVQGGPQGSTGGQFLLVSGK